MSSVDCLCYICQRQPSHLEDGSQPTTLLLCCQFGPVICYNCIAMARIVTPRYCCPGCGQQLGKRSFWLAEKAQRYQQGKARGKDDQINEDNLLRSPSGYNGLPARPIGYRQPNSRDQYHNFMINPVLSPHPSYVANQGNFFPMVYPNFQGMSPYDAEELNCLQYQAYPTSSHNYRFQGNQIPQSIIPNSPKPPMKNSDSYCFYQSSNSAKKPSLTESPSSSPNIMTSSMPCDTSAKYRALTTFNAENRFVMNDPYGDVGYESCSTRESNEWENEPSPIRPKLLHIPASSTKLKNAYKAAGCVDNKQDLFDDYDYQQ